MSDEYTLSEQIVRLLNLYLDPVSMTDLSDWFIDHDREVAAKVYCVHCGGPCFHPDAGSET